MGGDDQIRAEVMRPQQMLELTGAESWQLRRSVSIVTGMARLVRDPAAITRYEQLLEP